MTSAAVERRKDDYDAGRKDHDDPRVCQNCVRTEGSYLATLAYVVLNARTGKYHASAGYGQSDCGLDMTGPDWWWPV